MESPNYLVEAATAATGNDAVTPEDTRTEDQWLTRQDLADRWKKPKSTLNVWASKKIGPPYALFGRAARYRLSDVIAWEQAQFAQR